jgi:Flp pilus assembly protein CpaB
MVLAGTLGLVLTLAALREGDDRRAVLVAGRDVAAGSVLRSSDVREQWMRVDRAVASHFFGAEARRAVRQQVLTASLRAGDPLLRSQVRARAATDDRRAMSIPVDRARAVNGRLAPGDRVDIVVARDGVADVVAADLEVLDVDDGAGGAFGAARAVITVTLAVDVRNSQLLAAVLADGDFVLTRVTGASSAQDASPIPIDRNVP